MNVNLHIGRLVLEGLALEPRHGALVEAAVRAELTRLFGQGAPTLASTAIRRVQGAPLQASTAGNASHLGSAIAKSVHGAILP
jgi:hypothetical protein